MEKAFCVPCIRHEQAWTALLCAGERCGVGIIVGMHSGIVGTFLLSICIIASLALAKL